MITPASPATGLSIQNPLGAATGKSTYSFDLHVKELRQGDSSYTYFDWARAVRN
jgi:hypothetical protein